MRSRDDDGPPVPLQELKAVETKMATNRSRTLTRIWFDQAQLSERVMLA